MMMKRYMMMITKVLIILYNILRLYNSHDNAIAFYSNLFQTLEIIIGQTKPTSNT